MSEVRGDTSPNPFHKAYVGGELARNFPQAKMQQTFSPGTAQPAFSYLHNLDQHWFMGIGLQNKLLEHNVEAANTQDSSSRHGRWLALWTVSHTTLYIVRLSHPVYLTLGQKILYLFPARSGRLPVEREPGLQVEIGGALTAGIMQILSERSMLTLHVDRWRGTRTQKFSGIEVAAGLALALD